MQIPSWSGGKPRLSIYLLLLLSLFLGLGCGDSSPRRLIRVGSLLPAESAGAADAVLLPAGVAAPGQPYRVNAGLSAARVARLRLRARGEAGFATLSWRLAQDTGFLPFRTLSFPLVPDGEEHTYAVELQREPYWNGRVEEIRLMVGGGRLELLGVTGEAAGNPYRSMSLQGESLPSLPGLSRIEIDLPADLPRGSFFEAHLGLIPEYDRPRVRAAFRVYLDEVGNRPWLDVSVEGADVRKGRAWRPVRKELPAGVRRLFLEVAATRRSAPLPEGIALWGDPVLVTPGKATGKNLVVILVDTLRADVLGSYGDRTGITPHLDAFAREGVRLTELLAPSPWTLPSVSSLMTGLQPHTHGAGIQSGDFAPNGLTSGVRTLAETLGEAGFYNVGVYHNIYVNPAFGLQQGFDEYVSREERADVLVDEALARLRRSSDRRFFLYLHLFDLHNPYEPPAEECRQVAHRLEPEYRGPLGCSADRRPELPVPPPADRRWHEALYRAEIAYTDRQIGRFLKGMKDLGLDDDTVVAVLSDHGEEFWTRLDWESAHGYDPDGDHGHTLYQELLHVPAIIRDPGRPPGELKGPAEMVDLFPTLLRLVGIEPPSSEGRDLTPRFAGSPAEARPTLIADLLLHGTPRWSVRRGPWKLIVPRKKGIPIELYNLERDPGELHDLSGTERQTAASLRAWGRRILNQRKAERLRYLAGDESVGATYLEWNHITKLRSLGYLK